MLDYFMHTRVMYHTLHKSGFADQYMVQDMAVPYHAANEFMQFLDRSFGQYPISLAPVDQAGHSPDAPRGLLVERPDSKTPDRMINFGVWGPGSGNRTKFVEDNRRLDQKVQSLNGRKWLYAHAYYTADEFWDIYDRRCHDDIRAKYNAAHLPNVYDKVKVDVAAEEKVRNDLGLLQCFGVFGHSVGSTAYTKPCEVVTTCYLESDGGSVCKRQKHCSHSILARISVSLAIE